MKRLLTLPLLLLAAPAAAEEIGEWIAQANDGRVGKEIGKLHLLTFFRLAVEGGLDKIVTVYLLNERSMTAAPILNAPPAEPRQRQSAETRREETVEAVIDLASEHSPEGITTQAIATRIGVTHGALFRHFPDKLAIWTAVLEWTCAELNHRFDNLSADLSPLARLEAWVDPERPIPPPSAK